MVADYDRIRAIAERDYVFYRHVITGDWMEPEVHDGDSVRYAAMERGEEPRTGVWYAIYYATRRPYADYIRVEKIEGDQITFYSSFRESIETLARGEVIFIARACEIHRKQPGENAITVIT